MPRKANATAKSFLNLSKLVKLGHYGSEVFWRAKGAQRSLKAWGQRPRIVECENDQR
jgi:hypothetical protein